MIGALKTFIKVLPVIGFNPGKFGLNLIKKHLVHHLVPIDKSNDNDTIYHGCTSTAFVNNMFVSNMLMNNMLVNNMLVHNMNLTCLTFKRLTFFDIINYLAPGLNFDKYLNAYGCTQTKGFLPNEWMTSSHKLDCETFLPKETFHSELKNERITDENHAYYQ